MLYEIGNLGNMMCDVENVMCYEGCVMCDIWCVICHVIVQCYDLELHHLQYGTTMNIVELHQTHFIM